MRIALFTLLLLCLVARLKAQVTIYQEDFSGYPNGTTTAAKWSSAFTNCDGTGFWGVSGGAFTVNDIEGAPCGCGGNLGGNQNTWASQNIPITGYSCVSFSLEIGAQVTSGTFDCQFPGGPVFACDNSAPGHDQALVEYSVNGGAWVLAVYICGDNGAGTISVDGLQGTGLRLRVRLGNQAVGETYTIDDVIVQGTTIPPPTIAGPNSVCTGGSITLTAQAGFSSYNWSNGDSGQSINVTTAGAYRVTVTDANGCTAVSNPKNITVTPPPTVSIIGPTQVCPNGTISLSTNTTFASYAWSTGETTQNAIIDAPSTYTVTVTNAAGCTNTASRTITAAPAPNASITGPTALCAGSSINLTATGGTSYRWSTNAMTAGISVNRGGTYTVTVTNAAGCTATTSTDISESPRPSVDNPGPQMACGSLDLLDITGTNLTENRAYFSAPNGGGQSFAPGDDITTTRTLYAYDAVTGLAGCSSQQSFFVTVAPKPTLDDIANKIACDTLVLPNITGTTLTNGRAYYSAPNAGGTKYAIGQAVTSNLNLYAYDGTATCNDQKNFTATILPKPTVNDLRDTSTCAGFMLPSITGTNLTNNRAYYTGTNGTGTRFIPFQTITTSQNLFIYDANAACKSEQTVNITITAGPKIAPIRDTTVCLSYTLPDITETNPTANRAYFTGPNGTGTRLNVGQAITNSQTLYAYDAQGICSDQDSFRITIVSTPTVNDLPDPTSCGFFVLPIINGMNLTGNQAYYTQTNGGGTRYQVTDTLRTTTPLFLYDGAPGCSDEESVLVTILQAPIINSIRDTSACSNFILTAIQGPNVSANAAYFTQSNGAGTRFATGDTLQTTITLFAFDTNGTCSNQDTFTITILPAPILNPINDTTACVFFKLPTIKGTGLSANAAYFTQANGTGTRFAVGDTIKTTTNLFTFDTNGACQTAEAFRVTIAANPIATITTKDAACNGAQDGELEVTVLGSSPPFIFNWNVNVLDGQQNVTGAAAGNYSVTITDANRCVTTATATISQPTPLNLQCAQRSAVSMTGLTDGSAQLIINGSVAPYNVVLTGPTPRSQSLAIADTIILQNLASGTYQATVTDANGCATTCNFAINILGCDIKVNFAVTNATCATSTDGAIAVTLVGAMPPFQFDWNVDSLDGRANVTNLPTGNYVLNVTDANNCLVSGDTMIIARFPAPQATMSTNNIICEDKCFEINIALNGIPPFRLDYQLSTNVGDIFRSIVINSNTDTLQICPATLNTDSGSVIVQLVRLQDANCQADLTQRDTLFVRPISRDTIQQTLCSNDSLVVNNRVYNQARPSGIENFSGAAVNSCDSIIVVDLTFLPPVTSDSNVIICEADSIVVNGTVYNLQNPTGTETLIGAAANGCDSTVTITLQFFPRVTFNFTQTICETDSIIINGTVYNQQNPSGTEILPGAATNGCDSVINVTLQFFPRVTFSLTPTICETDNIIINSTVYNQNNPTGTETLIGAAANGCDSIINITLQFFPTAVFTLNPTICETDSIIVNGTIYNQNNPTGTETLAGASVNGCDSIVNISLQFFPIVTSNLNPTICEADSIIVNGTVYNQTNPTGTERLLGVSVNGCDSIITINLQFFPIATFTLTQTICETDSITVNGTIYNQANPTGIETLVGASINDCDSIINVTLQFFPTADFMLDAALCEGDSVVVNGTVYNQNNASGMEKLASASANGCDSIINIRLTFLEAARTTIDTTLCPGDSIEVNGTIYNVNNPSSTEIITGGASNGCDSVIQVNVRFFAPAIFNLTQVICETDSIVVNGTVYNFNNPTGIEMIVGASVNGCDSIVDIALQFFPTVIFDLEQILCETDSLIINGTVYNQQNPSGIETLLGASVNGCDSIININLQFSQTISSDLNQTVCTTDSIVINGTVYNQANPNGTETLVGGSASGCDSIINVNLQFFSAATSNFIQTICTNDSVVINGTVYNQNNPSGTETLVGASVNGCDSIVLITLQFFPAVASNFTQTICTTDSVIINGAIYNQSNPSGTETLIGASVNGCDSVVNVRLQFFPAATSNFTQTICANDSLIINGTVYNQNNSSGTETLVGASVNGCDSIVLISLTFLQAVQKTLDTLLCPGETIVINGKTYNETTPTGTEILQGAAASGCDSIVQINLRFRPAVRGAIEGNATLCAGDSTTLTFRLSGASTYDVRYSDGRNTSIELRNISDSHTIQVAPSATTTYTIVFMAINGSACPAQIGSSATVQVSNLSANVTLTSNFAGFGVSCADATDGTLQAAGTNGVSPLTYRWSTGAAGPQLQNIGAGIYNVTVSDAAGCTAIDSIIVIEPESIIVTSTAQSPNCAKDKTGSISIDNISGGAAPFEVSLDGKSYRAVNNFPYQLNGLAAGNYTVFVRDANDCETQIETTIVAPSEPQLDLGPDITVRLGDSVLLEGLANFVPTNIDWRPDTFLTFPNSLRTIVTPTETISYTLTISDTSGCKASDQITVFLNRARGIFIPTAFTPNGDGSNDLFIINGGNDVKNIKEFRVFDRWGNLMFHRSELLPNDPQFGWDGTFNGKKVNIGVYVYYAKIEFIDGLVEVFQGDVTVVR